MISVVHITYLCIYSENTDVSTLFYIFWHLVFFKHYKVNFPASLIIMFSNVVQFVKLADTHFWQRPQHNSKHKQEGKAPMSSFLFGKTSFQLLSFINFNIFLHKFFFPSDFYFIFLYFPYSFYPFSLTCGAFCSPFFVIQLVNLFTL